ncbi:MAG: glucan endo-1,6-beta-glucosidase [Bacteroidales bacterium]|nr:glucan endo-1,6-beta-glucosidase [Bacteroidales bacterium]
MAISLICCDGKDNPDTEEPPVVITPKANVFLTRGDKTQLFNKVGELAIKPVASTSFPVISLDTSVRFQEVEGYGAALTGSSAYLIKNKLSIGARQTLLNDLFNPATGIGISYLRLTMGASDFSLSDFTYNDLPAGQTDYNLEQFSLSQDLQDVVPVLKEIVQISPGIRLMGSPWSPPAWMKTNGNLKGGKLKSEAYDVYADYFVRYIQAMKNEGIAIDAVTPQNEPLYFTANYPCMEMQPAEQLNFIKTALGPKFEAAELGTKIIVYDHNWDNPQFPITILNSPDAAKYVAGSAFHAYAGDVSAMTAVHNAHPDKGLYFTEISGGAWANNFSDNLMWNMNNIFIGTARNWSKNALLWNLALDESYGPQNNGCNNCRGVITISAGSGLVTKNEEYYSIAHFSKFVRPGAVRIGTNVPQTLSGLSAVGFQNADGTKVLVACNDSNAEKALTVSQDKNNFSYTVPAKSVVTIVW